MPASAELSRLFREVLRDWPEAESRQMFGAPCAFAHGQMFFLLFKDEFALRLADEDRAAFSAATGAALFEAMPGRAMREYVVVSPELARPPEALRPSIAKALAYVQALPPKASKPRKQKAAR